MSSDSRNYKVNWSSFQQKKKGPAPSTASALAPKNKGEYIGKNLQNFGANPTQSQSSVAQGLIWAPACTRLCKTHLGKCRQGKKHCFKSIQEGHFIKECSRNMHRNGTAEEQTDYML